MCHVAMSGHYYSVRSTYYPSLIIPFTFICFRDLPLLAFASLTCISDPPKLFEQGTKTLQKDLWAS